MKNIDPVFNCREDDTLIEDVVVESIISFVILNTTTAK
jgi:hypothetical protein